MVSKHNTGTLAANLRQTCGKLKADSRRACGNLRWVKQRTRQRTCGKQCWAMQHICGTSCWAMQRTCGKESWASQRTCGRQLWRGCATYIHDPTACTSNSQRPSKTRQYTPPLVLLTRSAHQNTTISHHDSDSCYTSFVLNSRCTGIASHYM